MFHLKNWSVICNALIVSGNLHRSSPKLGHILVLVQRIVDYFSGSVFERFDTCKGAGLWHVY